MDNDVKYSGTMGKVPFREYHRGPKIMMTRFTMSNAPQLGTLGHEEHS